MRNVIATIIVLGAIASCECATVKEAAKAGLEALVDCSSPAVVKVAPAIGDAVEKIVTDAAMRSPANWAPVKELGKAFSRETGGCLIGKVIAKLSKPAPADAPQGLLAMPTPEPAILRSGFRALSVELYGGATFRVDGEDL